MTYEEIKQQCEIFKIGDIVYIKVVKKDDDGHRAHIENVEAVVKNLSTNVIVAERGGILESFSHTDIVLNGALVKKEKKQSGRKRARRKF